MGLQPGDAVGLVFDHHTLAPNEEDKLAVGKQRNQTIGVRGHTGRI